MMNNKLNIFIIISTFVLLIAYYYQYFIIGNNDDNNNNYILKTSKSIEKSIINSWKHLIKYPKRNTNLKILLGLNTNVDLIVPAVELFDNLNITSQLGKRDHSVINSIDQFRDTFAYFFEKGHAAERSFSNKDAFNRILESAVKCNSKQWFIGGNAGLMAQSILKRFPNFEVTLVGPIGNKLKQLLNSNIKMPNEILIEDDEVHLIVEYAINEIFHDLKSPTANRFIVSHDYHNAKMTMLDIFFNLANKHEPDVIILAGLHLLETQTDQFKKEKLESLKNYLENIPKTSLVHLELASFGDIKLVESIINTGIFTRINSLGLNEQELLFLSHAGNGPHSNYFKELHGRPDLNKIIDIIQWILETYGENNVNKNESKLTRVHFHYLLYHIIAISNKEKWSNTISSVMSGSKIASKQACDYEFDASESDEFSDKVKYKFETTTFKIDDNTEFTLNETNPIIKFKRNHINFYLTPVLVCKQPVKTVGLGDAISSNGLIYASFNR